MVYGNAAIGNLSASSYALNAYSFSGLSFPVSPSNYIYSQFKHVSGTPAPEGSQGVSISKLKILDVLIDQLVQIKSTGAAPERATGPLSEERLDALINQYETQIRGAHAAKAIMPYTPAPASPMGLVVDLVA